MNELFEELKSILSDCSTQLNVIHDEPGYYYLETNKQDEKGKSYFFGMVKIGPKKVAFHLMPIYCDPSILNSVSPVLKKKMQGKSCFNFTKMEPELIKELQNLVKKCFDSYRAVNKI